MGTKRAPALGERLEVSDGGKIVGSGEVGDRLTDAEIPGGECVDITPGSHGDDIGSPGADTGKGDEGSPEPVWIRIVEIEVTVDHSLGNRRDRGGPPTWHSGFWVIAEADQGKRVGELVGEPERGRREWDSVTFGQASRHGGGTGNADLLADNHSHHRLEPIPATDHTKPGTGGYEGAENRIVREVGVGRLHIVVEAEEPAHSGDLIDDRLEGRQMSGEEKMIRLPLVRRGEIKLDNAGVAADGHGPTIRRGAIDISDKRFDTGGDPRSKVRTNRGQVHGFDEGQPQLKPAVGGETVAPTSLGAELTRREPEDLLNDSVHLAHTAEAARAGDDTHRKVRLVEQATGEVGATRTGNEVRGGAHVLLEEAPKLASRVAHTIGKGVFVEAIEKPVGDQLDGCRDRLRRLADLD